MGDSEDTAGWDPYYGHGRINAFNAVTSDLLGITQITVTNDNIIIYPNPVINDLTIDNLEDGNYNIILYDMLGKKQFIYSATSNNNRINMSIPSLTSGTYFMKIIEIFLNKTVTKKIVIQ